MTQEAFLQYLRDVRDDHNKTVVAYAKKMGAIKYCAKEIGNILQDEGGKAVTPEAHKINALIQRMLTIIES